MLTPKKRERGKKIGKRFLKSRRKIQEPSSLKAFINLRSKLGNTSDFRKYV